MTEVTPKVILWTSEVLLNHKIFPKILVLFYLCLGTSHPLKMLKIMENNIQLFVCDEIVSLGTIFDSAVFPRNDRRLSFHTVNRWHLLQPSIRRKCDSDQDVAFC